MISFTLYSHGEVEGALLADGSFAWAPPAPEVAKCWDEATASWAYYELFWCGATKRHAWSHTRGELLGDYALVPSPPLREVAGRLRVRVATWARRRPISEATGEEMEVE